MKLVEDNFGEHIISSALNEWNKDKNPRTLDILLSLYLDLKNNKSDVPTKLEEIINKQLENGNIVSSYSVSNINLGRKVTYKDLDINLFLGIKNIFNERYNNNIRINAFGGRFFEPAPKRNTYTGITLEKKF